ncbi:hypothetical protein COB21_02795 [Candidatus Aerophobetes bacterium]|uniref:Cell shape-determining protein MreC n=1 Tax=Aerophobetes bacterium TaxID=2030807 RepID=A0A2A4X4Y3_UNCAE|nr:MAG: hypothetical protein COB21_02795 [Candidatus Aerophobetes bacterium]
MEKIKRVSVTSILPLLLLFFLMFQMPTALVKKIRRGMLHTMIPLQRMVGRSALFSFSNSVTLEQESTYLDSPFKGDVLYQESSDAIAAQVVFRSFRSYSHCIWIDIGSQTNDDLGRACVEVNSPVLSKGVLVGVVDEVCPHVSKVRLITDKKFSPSVRALRKGDQERYLLFNLKQALENLKGLADPGSKREKFSTLITSIEKSSSGLEPSCLLGKGELQGSVSHSIQAPSLLVKGVGFNYKEGSMEASHDARMRLSDLLVTTGLDGIFPQGIPVAVVTKVDSQTSHEPFYAIEARLLAEHIFNLQYVTVLPSKNVDFIR